MASYSLVGERERRARERPVSEREGGAEEGSSDSRSHKVASGIAGFSGERGVEWMG
jgi:hypothetical protein